MLDDERLFVFGLRVCRRHIVVVSVLDNLCGELRGHAADTRERRVDTTFVKVSIGDEPRQGLETIRGNDEASRSLKTWI